MNNYLVNANATVETDITPQGLVVTVEIDHDGPGPLVELLGVGAEPANPLVLDANDLLSIGAPLRDLEVEAIIDFVDHPSVADVEYHVKSPRMLADSILTGAVMRLDMVSADGSRADLDQTLATHTWTVEYVDGIGALDGDIAFSLLGGPFDYEARLHYP